MRQTLFLTGASSGIGRATALHFQARGWNVVATMRDPSAAGDLAALDDVLCVRLDVLDHLVSADVGNGAADHLQVGDRVSVVVNGANAVCEAAA